MSDLNRSPADRWRNVRPAGDSGSCFYGDGPAVVAADLIVNPDTDSVLSLTYCADHADARGVPTRATTQAGERRRARKPD